MIDVHCHILPGRDDGARNLEESLVMARALVREGFEAVVATPHVVATQFPNPSEEIMAAAACFREALAAEGIPLTVYTGGEYYLDRALPELAREYHPIAGLAGSHYVLVELPVMNLPLYLDYSIWPKDDDPPELRHALPFIRPVIAHPERNQKILHDINILRSLREMGYFFQVNLEAIVGLGGSKVVRLVKQMARENLIDFIGSDGHRPEELRQVLSGWRRQTEKLLGPEVCERVLKENPACLVRNEPIELEK